MDFLYICTEESKIYISMKKVFKPMLVLAFITLVSYNVYSS